MSSPAEIWFAKADPDRYRDASDDQPAPFREHGPDPYDEPYDFSTYGGPHGYVYFSPSLATCECGWHPWNHPGFSVVDHLTDWGVNLGRGTATPRASVRGRV